MKDNKLIKSGVSGVHSTAALFIRALLTVKIRLSAMMNSN